MGQVPPKQVLPSAPYGASSAINAVNQVQPIGQNPQQPLLPPNYQGMGNTAPSNPNAFPASPVQGPQKRINPAAALLGFPQ